MDAFSCDTPRQPSGYKIMVFTWNTESIGLCETMDINTADYNRSSCSNYIPGFTTWQYQCDIPDFYPKFAQFIIHNSPDLVVIGFQEDRYPGSYFHSHLLPSEMPKIGYDLVKRTKLMGIGVTTYKGIWNGDFFERGIRVSIYAKKDLVPLIEKEEDEMRAIIGNDGQSEYVCSSFITRGKGATVSYIILPGLNKKSSDEDNKSDINRENNHPFGRIAFICCHLPFNSRSLITERLYKNRMLRQNEINQSNICFNNIIEELVLFKDPIPTYVIFFGDFNYRLADTRPASEVANEFNAKSKDIAFIRDMYMEYDELREQMRRKNIYEFSEGIGNQGPIFVPTCKMVKGRSSEQYCEESMCDQNNYFWQTGSHNHRVPSWCDRILYHKFKEDDHNMVCTYYDRFDVGTVMSKSDHAGVIGLFELY